MWESSGATKKFSNPGFNEKRLGEPLTYKVRIKTDNHRQTNNNRLLGVM